MINRIRYIIRKQDKELLKVTVGCNHSWYGNKHAGFFICPDLLDSHSVVYSFGIGEDISFDQAVIENHGCTVCGFDPTPKSVNWINGLSPDNNFRFFDFGISEKSGPVEFFLPKNPDHVSGSLLAQSNVDTMRKVRVEMKSLPDIMTQLGHDHIDVLKMDIEGAEYGVLAHILKQKLRIGQILVEFHDRFFDKGTRLSEKTIKALEKNGYRIFAVSGTKEEVSFIHRRELKRIEAK
ncbi:MAG: FkbM family methyltransferase [Bacteroidota bacterium]